jgi:hypothetical protein
MSTKGSNPALNLHRRGFAGSDNQPHTIWSFHMKKLIAALITSMFAIGAFAAEAAASAPAAAASAPAKKAKKAHHKAAKKAAVAAEAASK